MPRDNTACLTCRSRKVKCDRLSPSCSTCSKLNRQCVSPASSPEITWLASDIVGDGAHEDYLQNENQLRQHGAKGRQLLSDPERARHVAAVLSSIQNSSVEVLLAELDCRFEDSPSDDTITAGPFSLFQLSSASKLEETDVEAIEVQTVQSEESAGIMLDHFPMDDILDAATREPAFAESSLRFVPGAEELCDATSIGHDFFTPIGADALTAMSPMTALDELPLILPPCMPITYSFNVENLDFPTIRLLLDRYQHALVPYFSPARIQSKSPWETLHIPKVYETLGEFMVRGDAGNSKVSLLFAVLGASAFHLDILLPISETATLPWRAIGNNYRMQAKARLKVSLQSLSSGRKLEDYQDVLMALLSMVTLCVVSGDMEDAYAYLRDVEHLIALYDVDKTNTSPGVRMLHSTFLYLRTLQASVGIFGIQAREILVNGHLKRPSNVDSSMVLMDPNISLWSSLLREEERRNTSITLQALGKAPCHICGKNKSIFEQIYSLPEPLFKLISRVTALAQRMERRQASSSTKNPELLVAEANKLETDICDWQNDILDPEKGSFIPPCPSCVSEDRTREAQESKSQARVSLLYHFREAMHAALLIYFYRCVRNVDTHILQQFVDKTFDHLTRYGQFKRESNDPSSNLCWPGFIAGCEASNPETRSKISAWFSSETALTGIRMFEVAGQAVRQVWEARDLAKNRNLPWSKILMESSTLDRLVLS
ncbi:arginine metabolism regulation protein II [Thelonectria olida]|uniref:Arginine metabolism regulation protein II n=1 Tax=Thelonectria olida TaxID=1576542 RepID=A0A9P8W0P9_9HYPO|nr:arginine metabolism regulation protein II [Thelonectria olida]